MKHRPKKTCFTFSKQERGRMHYENMLYYIYFLETRGLLENIYEDFNDHIDYKLLLWSKNFLDFIKIHSFDDTRLSVNKSHMSKRKKMCYICQIL